MENCPLTLVETGLQAKHRPGTPTDVMKGCGLLHPQLTFEANVQYSSLTPTPCLSHHHGPTCWDPSRVALLQQRSKRLQSALLYGQLQLLVLPLAGQNTETHQSIAVADGDL